MGSPARAGILPRTDDRPVPALDPADEISELKGARAKKFSQICGNVRGAGPPASDEKAPEFSPPQVALLPDGSSVPNPIPSHAS